MEGASEDDFPCSSLAADSIIRIGLAGSAWGLFIGPYEANIKGIGTFRLVSMWKQNSYWVQYDRFDPFISKGTQYIGLFAGVFTATHCGIQRYRMEKDWVNACVAGALTGAALAARTRSWVQIFGTATIVSAIATAADSTAS